MVSPRSAVMILEMLKCIRGIEPLVEIGKVSADELSVAQTIPTCAQWASNISNFRKFLKFGSHNVKVLFGHFIWVSDLLALNNLKIFEQFTMFRLPCEIF